MADCAWYDAVCHFKGGAADVAESLGQSVATQFVTSLAEGTITVLGWLNSFWLGLPSPNVTTTAVTVIQENMSWYTFVFALVGIFLALGKMAITHQFSSGTGAVRMILNLIVTSAMLTAGFTALMTAGDAFAPWIVKQVTAQDMNLDGFITVAMIMQPGIGPGFVLALFAFFGALANVAFMIVRDGLVLILFAFIPTLAAASNSEAGGQAFKKALGYLLACILFKPVAGVIYALGMMLLKNPVQIDGLNDTANALYSVCVAVVVLSAAALALPALIKFIAPAIANGTSGAFSGAAVLGATVAAGAAVVGLGAAAGSAPALASGGGSPTGGPAGPTATAGPTGPSAGPSAGSSPPPAASASTSAPAAGPSSSSPPASATGGNASSTAPSGGHASTNSTGSGSGPSASGGTSAPSGSAQSPGGSTPPSAPGGNPSSPGGEPNRQERARIALDLAEMGMSATGAIDDLSEDKR